VPAQCVCPAGPARPGAGHAGQSARARGGGGGGGGGARAVGGAPPSRGRLPLLPLPPAARRCVTVTPTMRATPPTPQACSRPSRATRQRPAAALRTCHARLRWEGGWGAGGCSCRGRRRSAAPAGVRAAPRRLLHLLHPPRRSTASTTTTSSRCARWWRCTSGARAPTAARGCWPTCGSTWTLTLETRRWGPAAGGRAAALLAWACRC
jgi:hypothetical protein